PHPTHPLSLHDALPISDIARDHARYPWMMGYLPSFVGEGVMDGRRIAQVTPRAKIAVLYENSNFGKDMLSGLKRGLEGKGKLVRSEEHTSELQSPDLVC